MRAKSFTACWLVLLLVVQSDTFTSFGQTVDVNRLRELRQKMRDGSLTAAEKAELDAGMKARLEGRPITPSTIPAPKAEAGKQLGRDVAAQMEKRAQYEERQMASFERMRQQGEEALAAAAARRFPEGPAREFFVNNETGDDVANGLAAQKGGGGGPVKTLAKGVSMLKPGDTLHLAVTSRPYYETIQLNDGFGGVAGKPIVIEGHGAIRCDWMAGWRRARRGCTRARNFFPNCRRQMRRRS